MMFTQEGHLHLNPNDLLTQARNSVRVVVNRYLLVGTPQVFPTYDQYCAFRAELAEKLHVHPAAMFIRGSARFGYSTTPRKGRAWRKFSSTSDIDVAIADVDYFSRLDSDVRQYESRQRLPHYLSDAYKPYARRQEFRAFNCVADDCLPPNTCDAHVDITKSFDTTPYCGAKYKVGAFVYRDLWSLRNRCEYDLRALCEGVRKGIIDEP